MGDMLIGYVTAQATDDASGDIFAAVLLGLIVVFFLWLIIAALRKKLSTSQGRIGEFKEDADEASRTARLWKEAKRRAEEEEKEFEEEEEEEEEDDGVDIGAQILEKAKQRREERSTKVVERHQESQKTLAGDPQTAPAPAEEPAPVAAPTLPREKPKARPKPAPEEAAGPVSLEDGLKKTRDGFVSRLTRMFSGASLDEDELEEVEEILFTADIGVRTSGRLIEFIQNEVGGKEKADPAKLLAALKEKISSMLSVEAQPLDVTQAKPFVILMIGVNGTGKTTTIGKLAMQQIRAGRKVVLAAADTFRAAAAEQLEIWGERTGAQVIRGQEGADPGSVVFDAITAAKSQNADVVIVDTAGRLHTKVNLVEELKKIHRVCGKALEGAPHEVLLVLDATTGQNAISQAKQFHKAIKLTGMVLTKLDGTAKGGVIIGIADTFKVPVRYIGIGEGVEDLRPFEPEPFVKALFT